MKKLYVLFLISVSLVCIINLQVSAGKLFNLTSFGNPDYSLITNYHSGFNNFGLTTKSPLYGHGGSFFCFGAQGGLSIATFVGDFKNTNMKTGVTGGLILVYNSDQVVGGQVELNFVQTGTKATFNEYSNDSIFSSQADVNLKYNLTNIKLPMLVKGYFGSNIRVFVEGGPYLSFLTGAKVDSTNHVQLSMGGINFVDTTFSNSTDVKNKFNSFDYGFALGAGVLIPFYMNRHGRSPVVLITARYYFGLTNILKQDAFPGMKSRNSVFEVKAGITIPISK